MKKYSLYILSFLAITLLNIVGVFADECSQSCKISDAPAPALTEYFTNIEKVTQNIVKALGEYESNKDSETESKASGERNRVLASLNEILSFGKHFGSFDFEIALPITNEVPSQVKRDYNKLKQNTEKLTNILESSEKRGSAGVLVSGLCDGVSNCTLTEGNARFALINVIKNNEQITELYRNSMLDKTFLGQESSFILVSDDFTRQIKEYYNKDTLASCSSCEGDFMDRVQERIGTISNFNTGAKEGIKQWKDAWKVARGGKASSGYAEQEAMILSQHLESQGISTDQAGVIMGNLNRYNAGGISSSNPLFNSKNYAQTQIEPTIDTFNETLKDKLSSGEDKIPYLEITRVDTKVKETQEISQTIASIYEDQLPFSLVQDTSTQILQGRIIRMHFSLMRSINILTKQVPQTEKLCDKQGVGLGKCTFQ